MHELDAVLEKGAVRLLTDTHNSVPANREPHNQIRICHVHSAPFCVSEK